MVTELVLKGVRCQRGKEIYRIVMASAVDSKRHCIKADQTREREITHERRRGPGPRLPQ